MHFKPFITLCLMGVSAFVVASPHPVLDQSAPAVQRPAQPAARAVADAGSNRIRPGKRALRSRAKRDTRGRGGAGHGGSPDTSRGHDSFDRAPVAAPEVVPHRDEFAHGVPEAAVPFGSQPSRQHEEVFEHPVVKDPGFDRHHGFDHQYGDHPYSLSPSPSPTPSPYHHGFGQPHVFGQPLGFDYFDPQNSLSPYPTPTSGPYDPSYGFDQVHGYDESHRFGEPHALNDPHGYDRHHGFNKGYGYDKDWYDPDDPSDPYDPYDPATPTPDPATPTPDPATPTPDPATPTPDPATPTPDPGTPTPTPDPSPTPTPTPDPSPTPTPTP